MQLPSPRRRGEGRVGRAGVRTARWWLFDTVGKRLSPTLRLIECSTTNEWILRLPFDPGDAQDVGRARGAEWHAGGDHDALSGPGDLLAIGGAHRLLHHVGKARDVGEVDAMRAPQ